MKQQARATKTLHRPWAVWLALCIALLGALAPTLSHALLAARGQNNPLVEVCTSTGPRWMALGVAADFAADASQQGSASDNDALPDQPAAVLDHCPFCLLSVDRLAPLPEAGVKFFAAPGRAVAPQAPLTSFVVTFFAPSPPPRGPPVFS
jgi:hypothetical protein